MADREKVIKGLEHCTTAETSEDCYGCPYDGQCGTDPSALERDALALLKEQGPKVLTHDEAIVLPEGTPVWFEESTDAGQTFLAPMICHGNGLYGNRYMQVDAKQLYWSGRRFWNARPTDEQRKAVKWDDID